VPESAAEIHGVAGSPMTRGRNRSKGDSDGETPHLESTADGPGIDDRGNMQHAAPIETSETETADARGAIGGMTPLTQSKMHAAPVPAPAPEQPVPRRSALAIEILSFVLIAFLVVSALLFNFASPGRLINAPSGVTVQLPPMPAEPAPAVATAAPVAREDQPLAEAPPPSSAAPSSADAAPPSSAALPDVQPQAGSDAAPRAEPPAETAALPPAAAPVAPDAATGSRSEALPEPPTPAAPAATTAPVEETASLPPLSAEETEALIRHGDALLGTGDIVAARSSYERAALGGNRVAALGVAKTYDPVFLSQAGARGLRGDPARAALWYGKAAAAGDRQAQQRLRQLRAQFPQ